MRKFAMLDALVDVDRTASLELELPRTMLERARREALLDAVAQLEAPRFERRSAGPRDWEQRARKRRG